MFTLIVILLPILHQFKSPVSVISFGEFFLILCSAFLLLFGRKKRNRSVFLVPRGLIAFYIIPVFLTFISSFRDYYSLGEASTVIARMLFYFVVIMLSSAYFDYEKAIKIYLITCSVCCAYLIMQVASHYIIHFDLPILVKYSRVLFQETEDVETDFFYSRYGFRPSSFFKEPSFYSFYFAPLIIILLFGSKHFRTIKKMTPNIRIIFSIIFSISILLTTSNLGVVYLVVIWFTFILADRDSVRLKFIYRIIVVFALLVVLVWIINSPLFEFLIDRFMSGGSVGKRLYRGFIIFDKLDWLSKIVGVGINNIALYVVEYGIYTIYDENKLSYAVTITNRLITSGVIGFSSLVYFVYYQIIDNKLFIQRLMIIIMIINFFFSAGEYSYKLAFTIILYFCIPLIDSKKSGRRIKI